MDQNEFSLEPRHPGVPSGSLKQFLILWHVWCKQCTNLIPTVTPSPNGPKWDLTWPTHVGVPLGASKMIYEPMVCSTQTVHLSCIKIRTISKRTEAELLLEPHHQGVPSGASKTISKPMVHWQKPCHYLQMDWNELTLDPKWFPSQWYVWRKPCTCLPPTLTPSPNRPKQNSTWPTSPWSSIRCVHTEF
jgi:hypothetical protein